MNVLLCVQGALEIEIIEHFAALDPPLVISRRCVDNVELVASAGAGLGTCAVVSQMDLPTAAALHAAGVRIVGVAGAAQGCDAVASPYAPDVAACVHSVSQSDVAQQVPGVDPRAHNDDPYLSLAADRQETSTGKVIAVWGSAGSPGRSCVARDLAREFSLCGRALLIDGDTRHPSLVQMLALSEESSAIVGVARALNGGERGKYVVERACAQVAGFHFLAGLNSGTRWREIPEAVAAELWPAVREGWDWTVVDCAEATERDEYGYQDCRDGLTLSLLESADEVLLVGKTGPVGIRRLLDQLDRARELKVDVRVVVNRVSRERSGADREAISALFTEQGVHDIFWIREDTDHMRAAISEGKLLAEVAASCGMIGDLRTIATSLGASYPETKRGLRSSLKIRKVGLKSSKASLKNKEAGRERDKKGEGSGSPRPFIAQSPAPAADELRAPAAEETRAPAVDQSPAPAAEGTPIVAADTPAPATDEPVAMQEPLSIAEESNHAVELGYYPMDGPGEADATSGESRGGKHRRIG